MISTLFTESMGKKRNTCLDGVSKSKRKGRGKKRRKLKELLTPADRGTSKGYYSTVVAMRLDLPFIKKRMVRENEKRLAQVGVKTKKSRDRASKTKKGMTEGFKGGQCGRVPVHDSGTHTEDSILCVEGVQMTERGSVASSQRCYAIRVGKSYMVVHLPPGDPGGRNELVNCIPGAMSFKFSGLQRRECAIQKVLDLQANSQCWLPSHPTG